MPPIVDNPPDSSEETRSWQWVSDQVVAGIGHDMSDRLSSLYGLIQLAELDGSIGPALSEPLRSELGRVEELVHLLRLLAGGREEGLEPIRLAELIPTVASLLRRHRGLEGVQITLEVGPDPVVSARWSELLRELLRLVSNVARAAEVMDSEVMVRFRRDGESVFVEAMMGDAAAGLTLPAYTG